MNARKWILGAVSLSFIALMVGCSDSDPVTVAAVAGDDQEVLVGDSVSLSGEASTGVEKVEWTLVSAPSGSAAALSSGTSLTPTFTADTAGDYEIQLSINDGAAEDTVTITAKTILAVISLGDGTTITQRERYGQSEYAMNLQQEGGILSGASSRGAIASYRWEEIGGAIADPVNLTTEQVLQFTAPGFEAFQDKADQYKWQVLPISIHDKIMIFRLTVTDADGNTDSAAIQIVLDDGGTPLRETNGLTAQPVGHPIYLSGPTLRAKNSGESGTITVWNWTIASAPEGSTAVFADSGTTTSTQQFPRFTPDKEGIYRIQWDSSNAGVQGTSASIQALAKTNNVVTEPVVTRPSGTLEIGVSSFTGVGTIAGNTAKNPQCGTCHNGGAQPDMVTDWSGTAHAGVFSEHMSVYAAQAPEPYSWLYHTVGFGYTGANNGFDDLMSSLGTTFSSDLQTFDDFAASNKALAQLSGVQCESCHGAGGKHSGDPRYTAVSVSQTGACGQCHIEDREWANAGHNSTGVVHGAGRYQLSNFPNTPGCTRCHTGRGFVNYLEHGEEGLVSIITENGGFPGIQCAGCHDPHSAANPAQLRQHGEVEMVIDGSTVNAGKAAVCYTCHDGLYSHGEMDCDKNRDATAEAFCDSIEDVADYYIRQIHYNPQAPVLEGKGAILDINGDSTNDLVLTANSFHTETGFTLANVTGDATLPAENNKCVTCHMSAGPSPDEEGFAQVGGHTFGMRSGLPHDAVDPEDGTTLEPLGEVTLVSSCTPCHTDLTTINRTARADYDGDGSVEGIQDEVQGILLNLATAIHALDTGDNLVQTTDSPSSGSGTRLVDGVITADSFSFRTGQTYCAAAPKAPGAQDSTKNCFHLDSTRTAIDSTSSDVTMRKVRRAVWNYNLAVREASFGIHNAAYILQVLQQTYKAVDGSAYNADFTSAVLR